ncbi:hypothetical protein F4604DRAFT_1937270 [Suillus subluteus]|nr:hypothetical protein F4604DRAFT_1937270 [Suillus subluteus]
MPRHCVPENIEVVASSSATGSDSDSDDSLSDSDEELLKVHAAVASPPDDASTADLQIAQKLLLNMRGRQRELLKRNALLEASAAKGRKKLTHDELELAVKEEAIRLLGCKYSITHCLWINPQIFPLHTCPNIDLNKTDHEMMNHKHFGSHFAKGVGNVRSEMVSDIKSCTGAIFGLNPEFFLRGYDRAAQEEYSLSPNNFLKSAVLVKILKVSISRQDFIVLQCAKL